MGALQRFRCRSRAGCPPIQAQGVWNQQLPLWKTRVQPQLPFGKFGSLEHLKELVKNAKKAETFLSDWLRQREPQEPEVTAADVPSAGRAESETQLPDEQQKPQLEPMQQQQEQEPMQTQQEEQPMQQQEQPMQLEQEQEPMPQTQQEQPMQTQSESQQQQQPLNDQNLTSVFPLSAPPKPPVSLQPSAEEKPPARSRVPRPPLQNPSSETSDQPKKRKKTKKRKLKRVRRSELPLRGRRRRDDDNSERRRRRRRKAATDEQATSCSGLKDVGP